MRYSIKYVITDKKRWMALSLVALLVFCCAAGACVPPAPTVTSAELRVYYIDVGQGDAILIDYGASEVLIDGGDKSAGAGLVSYLVPLIQGQLEAVIATHPHADHIGGLLDVLNAFEVGQVWYNGDEATSQTYTNFITAAQNEGADLRVARRGDVLAVGTLILNILHPADDSGSTNNNSVVASLMFGSVRFLFTGDAEKEAEADMLSAGLIGHADILKAGHHASRTASSPAFLAAVTPGVAIYCAKTGNSYGHPHSETITALQAIGVDIYGTDVNGTIYVSTDGTTYAVHPERGQALASVS
jgi:beta-lactamase superfamily II metal-dependent hydrolase